MAGFVPRDHDAFFAHWARIRADAGTRTRTILRDGEIVGSVLAFERFGEREVGYWIAREHWGKGIATRALAEFLRGESGTVHARVEPGNAASLRVLEKCGFAVVGRERWELDGREVEDVILALDVAEASAPDGDD